MQYMITRFAANGKVHKTTFYQSRKTYIANWEKFQDKAIWRMKGYSYGGWSGSWYRDRTFVNNPNA